MSNEKYKILIVDDTPENIDILSGVLQEYELSAASDGETAIQILEEITPDLILLDVLMPGIDGFEVAKKLKLNTKTKDIPIIFATAVSDADSIIKGFEIGVSDYITKPIEGKEVLARVKKELLISKLTRDLKNYNLHLEKMVQERTKDLAESEENYKNIVNNALVGVFISKIDGEIILTNNAARKMLKYNEAEFLKLNTLDLFSDFSEMEKFITYMIENRDVSNFETKIKTKDNEVKMVTFYSSLRDDLITSMFLDITEIKNLELKVMQKQRLETIGMLATGFNNEIKTPLNSISETYKNLENKLNATLGFIEKVQDSYNEIEKVGGQNIISELKLYEDEINLSLIKAELPKQLKMIDKTVLNSLSLIEAIGDFSHPEKIKKEKSDINRGIQSSILISKNEWIDSADIVQNLDENLPEILCNINSINQVFLNLITNSIHSIQTKKVIEPKHKGQIKISSRVDEDNIVLTFQDNGIGIKEEVLNNIFNPFFLPKEDGRGIGLGLAISYDIIANNHNGNIKVDSEENKGALFQITLPINEN